MSNSNPPPTILVVDDEALLRWHATDVLTQHGYAVIEAEDAATALTILERRPDVRLLFTDIQMPGACNGMDLARKVHERWPNMLLLVTSGGVTVSDGDIPDDGRFMAKPYHDEEIVDQIDTLMIEKGEQPPSV